MSFLNDCQMVFKVEGWQGVGFHFRSRLWRWRYNLAKALAANPVKSIYGFRFEENYKDTTFKYYITGKYGSFYWSRLKGIRYPFVFLDIGANQGLYTLAASSNEQLEHAYAFEPAPSTASLLRKNIYLNGGEKKASVHEMAISDSAGSRSLIFDSLHSGAASIAEKNEDNPKDSHGLEVVSADRSVLNGVIKERGVGVHCKIDVEGHEREVLSELFMCAFAEDVVEVFFEVDERWVEPEEMLLALRNLGFSLVFFGTKKHYDVLAKRGPALSAV